MKWWHWALIVVAVVVFAAVGVLMLSRRGDAPWKSSPPAKSQDTLRIASFNTEGLFDPDDDPGLSGDNDDAPSDAAHLEAIASAILAIDADIVALQGVESLAAVEWFNTTYLQSAGYTAIASLDVGHARGIENAVLSRYPITERRVWPTLRLGGAHPAIAGEEPNPLAGKPIMFRRSPLMVRVEVPGSAPLVVFDIEHKGGDRFDYWRRAEAQAVARLCEQVGLNRRIVILGSFHCDPDDPCLQPYFDLGFADVFSMGGSSEFHATQTTGDRTDLILVNRTTGSGVKGTEFVLGGELAKSRRGADQATHLPVVVELQLAPE